MKLVRTFLLCLLLTWASGLAAQNLSQHRWEHRLIVLLTVDASNEKLLEQKEWLLADTTGLNERKLLVYTITPQQYTNDLQRESWQAQEDVYQKLKKKNGPFEFLLIGLDGGIKLRKTAPVKLDDLYRLIDSMPMRAAEIRRKNNE